MAHFPLFIDVQGRRCLIAGGGRVASRKVRTLLAYGADVKVIALDICPEIEDLLPPESRQVGTAGEEDLLESVLVVAATGSREENHRIAGICRQKQIPVNVIDCPEECSFLFPAVVLRGDISIGINTGGNSPGISRHIREQIQEAVPDYYGELADQIGQLRDWLKENISQEKIRRQILSEAVALAFRKERILTQEEINDLCLSLSEPGKDIEK